MWHDPWIWRNDSQRWNGMTIIGGGDGRGVLVPGGLTWINDEAFPPLFEQQNAHTYILSAQT